VAILSVIVCHTAGHYGNDQLTLFLGLGGKGVDLFFALSGWLLGQQLIRERLTTGTIELRRFWVRRWLRTLPAYYAVLLFTYAWQVAKGNWHLDPSYIIFAQRYVHTGLMPYFGISWSLCVEEHFYLLIAPFVLLTMRSNRLGLIALFVLFLFPSLFRNLGWYAHDEQSHVRFDQCLIGVLLAYIYECYPGAWRKLARYVWGFVGLALFGIAWNLVARTKSIDWVLESGPLVWSLISGAFLVLANSKPFWQFGTKTWLTRFFADRAYSLYLLHIEALTVMKKFSGLPFIVYLLLTLIISLIAAEILYRTIERPVMRARNRFSWAKSKSEHVEPQSPPKS
jgi:peptidoglycan/LPS O-acetylase OafA/YrhL